MSSARTGSEKKDVQDKVVAWAKKDGWLPVRINVIGMRGWPDFFFFGPWPVLVIVEFKRPGKTTADKHQAYIHKMFRRLGWPVYIVHNKEQGIDLLTRAKALGARGLPGDGDSEGG